jgi:hypothetical protein
MMAVFGYAMSPFSAAFASGVADNKDKVNKDAIDYMFNSSFLWK